MACCQLEVAIGDTEVMVGTTSPKNPKASSQPSWAPSGPLFSDLLRLTIMPFLASMNDALKSVHLSIQELKITPA